MVRVPLRFPAAVGSKVTSILQLAPTAISELQSSVSPKFVLASIAVILKDAVPELALSIFPRIASSSVSGFPVSQLLVRKSAGPKRGYKSNLGNKVEID